MNKYGPTDAGTKHGTQSSAAQPSRSEKDMSSTSSMEPLGVRIHKVLRYLKRELRPVAPDEIEQALQLELQRGSELWSNLVANPRVLLESDGHWRWRSKYYLRNRDDLLNLLKQTTDGIPVSELLDSYKDALRDIHQLAYERRPPLILAFRPSDHAKEVILFPNDPALYADISDQVRKLWQSIHVPDRSVVYDYLVQHGLKRNPDGKEALAALASGMQRPPLLKRRVRTGAGSSSRRIRLTNVHLEGTGIDLSRDYEPPS
ncbi:hypothetical protein F1559_002663 [Cyanidiococcus yangmingshanensis]|uniref:TFIIE beta domain-containing protein n=1 Tax=Cyanidiococcus yangmingshanensis TaxID=2690220 RepID=A0A7J7IKB6_9RHOD|nr:hypothetical protein F1559_002663 [Cyanidiococcus yangmingshanensis]